LCYKAAKALLSGVVFFDEIQRCLEHRNPRGLARQEVVLVLPPARLSRPEVAAHCMLDAMALTEDHPGLFVIQSHLPDGDKRTNSTPGS
jgi:hypothetical protein